MHAPTHARTPRIMITLCDQNALGRRPLLYMCLKAEQKSQERENTPAAESDFSCDLQARWRLILGHWIRLPIEPGASTQRNKSEAPQDPHSPCTQPRFPEDEDRAGQAEPEPPTQRTK